MRETPAPPSAPNRGHPDRAFRLEILTAHPNNSAMTTTSDVPDHATVEQRWQRLQDQLDQVGDRTRAEIDTAIASIDACLARLAALRQHLTDRP